MKTQHTKNQKSKLFTFKCKSFNSSPENLCRSFTKKLGSEKLGEKFHII